MLIGFLAGFFLFLLLAAFSEPGFILLLDHANLLFHEAGHPAFGLLNDRLAVYGGTLGQLTFPIILIVTFWRREQPIPFAAACIWLFENFLNISRYMADSRALQLPLVGGGDHDWNEILFRWNVLSYDQTIAQILKLIAWTGIFASALWILYLSRRKPLATLLPGRTP